MTNDEYDRLYANGWDEEDAEDFDDAEDVDLGPDGIPLND